MTIAEAISRVCDDAERYHAKKGLDSDGGYEAIAMVRAYKELNPDLKNLEIKYGDFRGVYGSNHE